MLVVRDLRRLRDQDLARLGDVAVFLGNLNMLHGLGSGTRISVSDRTGHPAFDWVFCALPFMFFTRMLSSPLYALGRASSVPDLCFGSDHELPRLTLCVPPGYVNFIRRSPWDVVIWATYCPQGDLGWFVQWWTQRSTDTSFPGLAVSIDDSILALPRIREQLVQADLESAAQVPDTIDPDTQAKLYCLWRLAISSRPSGTAGCHYGPALGPDQLIEDFERVRSHIAIRTRPCAPPPSPVMREASPFEGTVRVSFRWLTVLLAVLAVRLKRPSAPLGMRLDLSRDLYDHMLAMIDLASDIVEACEPADLSSSPPNEYEVELALEVFRSASSQG